MFSRAVRLLTLQGFDIKVDPSWLLIAALITWSLSAQYFPGRLEGQSQSTYIIMGLIAAFGFFVCLLLHELSHSVVARRHGVTISSITLFVFGGVAEMVNEPPSAEAEFQIALAGPAMSIALAGFFGLTAFASGQIGLAKAITEVVSYLGTINLILALFNLLPAFPLDGGRVLRAWLWQRSGNVVEATKIAAKSGKILAYLLIATGLLVLFGGAFVAGLWQIFIGVFLLSAANASKYQQVQKQLFANITVADAMNTAPVVVAPEMTLSHVVDQIVLRRGHSFLPVVENGVLLGKMDRAVLSSIDREHWGSTKVDDVFVDLANETLLEPGMPIADLLELIGSTQQRKFLVTQGHRLVGVISLADLTRYFALASFVSQKTQPPHPQI